MRSWIIVNLMLCLTTKSSGLDHRGQPADRRISPRKQFSKEVVVHQKKSNGTSSRRNNNPPQKLKAGKKLDPRLNWTWFSLAFLEWRFTSPRAVGLWLRAAHSVATAAVTQVAMRSFRFHSRHTSHARTIEGATMYIRGESSVEQRATRLADVIIAASAARGSSWFSRPLRVLCLDGGGTKGRNLFVVIKEIEAMMGRPVAEVFDVVCGSSIGGAAALFIAGLEGKAVDSAARALDGLEKRCFAKTSKGRFLLKGHLCREEERITVVREILGGEPKRLVNVPKRRFFTGRTKAFAVAARLDEETNQAEPFLFRTYPTLKGNTLEPFNGTSNATIIEAIDATSAAPTLFRQPVREGDADCVFHDGGCVFNNPSLLALHEIAALWPHRKVGLLVSIGCGHARNQRRAPAILTHQQTERAMAKAHPRALYARLDPLLSRKYKASEYRERLVDAMQTETRVWLRQNATRTLLDDVLARLKL